MEVNNYEIKETTSIQTGKRDRDAEWAGPISYVMDKNLGRISYK